MQISFGHNLREVVRGEVDAQRNMHRLFRHLSADHNSNVVEHDLVHRVFLGRCQHRQQRFTGNSHGLNCHGDAIRKASHQRRGSDFQFPGQASLDPLRHFGTSRSFLIELPQLRCQAAGQHAEQQQTDR